jgi:hypothetical protein
MTFENFFTQMIEQHKPLVGTDYEPDLKALMSECWQAAQDSKQVEIDALKARITELEKQNQWQPIETAPRDCIIQIKTSDNKVYAGCYNPNGTKWTWCLIYGAKQTPDSSDEELAFDYETVKESVAMQWKYLQ